MTAKKKTDDETAPSLDQQLAAARALLAEHDPQALEALEAEVGEANATAAVPTDAQGMIGMLTQAIVGATNASGPIKQIPITKYKGKTPWNPTGARENRRPKFTREYWQNGAMVHRWQVTDADVALLNKLTPGRFMDRRVEVIARQADEGNTEATAIEIRYNNKTSDQRFENKNWFVNFSQLLRKLVAEIEHGPDVARDVA